jgi:hypothetical protein
VGGVRGGGGVIEEGQLHLHVEELGTFISRRRLNGRVTNARNELTMKFDQLISHRAGALAS